MTNYVPVTNLFNKPVGVAVDLSYNIFVLNRASGTNGYVLRFDSDGELLATNLTKLTNAAAIAVDASTNIYVTASNRVFKVNINTGVKTLIATINDAGCSLQGIVAKRNGTLAVCDAGRNGILFINPNTGVVTTNAGFHGVGDFITVNNYSISNTAKFFQPYGVAETGDGTLIVSDFGNHRIKAVLPNGVVSNICSVSSSNWGNVSFPGWYDNAAVIPDTSKPNAQSRQPNGIAYAYDGSIYVSEDFYHTIRKITGSGLVLLPPPPVPPPAAPINLSAATNFGSVTLTWSASSGATNYYVKRSQSSGGPYTLVGSTTGTTYTDTTVINGTTYYYVVTASNANGESANSAEVSAHPPLPPVPDPQIGYVDFPATSVPFGYTSVFHPSSSIVFNNDFPIVIVGAAGSQTFYTVGTTTNLGSIPNPTGSSSSAPSGYQDGLSQSQVSAFNLPIQLPDFTIKAIGKKSDGSPDSAVVSSRFQFVVANPVVSGNNSAFFTITDPTANAHLYYTLDGSDPSATNANAIDLGTVATPTNVWTVGFPIQTNTLFKLAAFRTGYQPSSIVSNLFLTSGFQPTTIAFGFANGEASSDFVASPGQTFYAPVTLSLIGAPTIFSLQFNLIVTNGVTNSGPPITAGNFGFTSLLEKPIPGITPTIYEYIPPAAFVGLAAVPNPITYDGSTSFSSLLSTNNGLNLLGVGWIERAGATNLYDTTKQTLISFSQAHDTIFTPAGSKIIVGGFNVNIPANAQTNQSYKIRIDRASATSDGIGAPGSDVYIASPTNAGTGGGTINALKYITVGQRKYIAGSVYPFRWFNAGDFGSSNIVNADVLQVFQSAIYFLNSPSVQAPGSDFFDAMDSSGNIGALDSNNADPNFGNYTNSQTSYLATFGSLDPLFDGNDTTINQDVFGNGFLDVADVYVTFRRSLDPSLTWFRRFWNGGVRVADTGATNMAAHVSSKTAASTSSTITPKVASTTSPQVNFTAGDIIGTAGQTVQIPISATILGSYPLRVLMLNLTVVPLDGSPALTTAVSFSQTSAVLGTPYTTSSKGNGNYAAVWLNSTNAGLTGTAVIGNLNITIPATASGSAAYAIHFDHASASPNGLASFKNQTLTGVLTTTTRTNSAYGDGIPDSWRLRWFGTTNNSLSASNACPSGDGVNNWKKFVAGVDPNTANSFPKVNPKTAVTAGYTASIHWPSVSGKKYAIERSATLFNGSWSILTTNTGNGGDMGYDDNTTNKVKFYRVRILP